MTTAIERIMHIVTDFNSFSESVHTFDRLYSSSSKQCTRCSTCLLNVATSCKFKVKW